MVILLNYGFYIHINGYNKVRKTHSIALHLFNNNIDYRFSVIIIDISADKKKQFRLRYEIRPNAINEHSGYCYGRKYFIGIIFFPSLVHMSNRHR